MKVLFLHGWNSVPGGVKPTYLKDHGHTVINPALDDNDFDAARATAQAEFERHKPDVVVGSSRGGAVAMNIECGPARLVLLCPAWKKWGLVKTVKSGTVILHSRADDVVPFADSEELARNSGVALVEVGTDHRLADIEPLAAMLKACEEFNDNAISVEPTGVEPVTDIGQPQHGQEVTSSPETPLARSLAHDSQNRPNGAPEGCPSPAPDLARVIDLWPGLPEAIRRAFLALVDSTGG